MASQKAIALRALNRCNEQLDAIFERLDHVNDSLLHEKIDNDTWSVNQILNHLLESEELTLQYLNYKIGEGAKFGKESLKTKTKYSLAMVLYSFPVKFKAPAKLSQPSNNEDIYTIKSKYAKLRTSMEEFINVQDESFFKLASTKHVAIGRLQLVKMLRFFHKHVAHHEKQMLRRLIKLSE